MGGLSTVEDVLAAAYGQAGDPDDPAVTALRRAAALRAEALAATAVAQAQAGQPEEAQRSFDKALQTGLGIIIVWRRAEALQSVATAQIQAGQPEATRQTFDAALRTVQRAQAAWADTVGAELGEADLRQASILLDRVVHAISQDPPR